MSENSSETEQITSNSSDKQSNNEDELLQTMKVGEIDPAILVAREQVKIKYTKEELLEIGKGPASKAKPTVLDPNKVPVSILDPEKWNLERKKSDTPDAGSVASENGDNRRRPGDPRERIRKENDGIVLSPQRRSFNSGCFVPVNKEPPRNNRAHSPLGAKGEPHVMGVREIGQNTRRIGSGRIIRDSWDTDKDNGGENDFGFARGQSREEKYGERGMREDGKFGERRSFGREIDSRDKEKDGRRNSRYSGDGRRRYSENKEDEPEWFSSGPISQNDTIELRGFDEHEKAGKKKTAPSRVRRAKDWTKKKDSQPIAEEDKEKEEEEPKGRSTPTQGEDRKGSEERKGDAQKQASGDNSFNFDEFLKYESIPGLLANGVGGDGDQPTSRFSRWFKKESPNKELVESSRSSSIQEDNHIIKDLLKDINDSSSIPVSIHPPSDSNAYFAPISPAANTSRALGAQQPPNVGPPINIMEMLARGKQQEGQEGGWEAKSQPPPPLGGKILSLDELEAKIRHGPDHPANALPKSHQKPDKESAAAFKRLLQQAGGQPQNVPLNKQPPQGMSLLEMLSHSQQQDEARMAAAQHQQQHHLLNSQMHNDLTLKMQQQQLQKHQMDILGKLMSAGAVPAAQLRASPLPDYRELLNRPEAQAILQGLKRGEITSQHLYQQLANPALQPRHREMLLTILKLHGNAANYGPSPRVLSPAPLTHHLYQQQQQQQQQQQLRVSPLPPNAMHQRIPSPRELQVHTQNILQRALIKKKLEEQTENFRKKQEMARGASPNPVTSTTTSQVGGGAKGMSSPTPLAFTPTSVLRKMTADKDEGKENKAVIDNGVKPQGRPVVGMRPQPQVAGGNPQWGNQGFPPVKQGRPIVKANTNFQHQTADQFFAQLAQQQQQQPLAQQRVYQTVPSNQQRKPIVGQQYPSQGSQYGSAQSQYSHPTNPQSFSQPTPQQLRAQHQHRPSSSAQQQQQPPQQKPASQMSIAQQQGTVGWQQFLNAGGQQQQQNPRPGGSQPQPGSLSPSTADQLTRWFSPDLLERARVGELPSTANLARHALSLEEIERQAAPPVHN